MKIISATNGDKIQVDDEDYDLLARHTWYVNKNGYAFTIFGRDSRVFMHHMIMPTVAKLVTDHINRNVQDNQKTNLRIATKRLNSLNSKIRKDSPLGVKGVRKQNNKYTAYTTYFGKQLIFGYFNTLEEAVAAREKAMDELDKRLTNEPATS